MAGVAMVAAAQVASTCLPPLRAVLGTRPVALGDGIAIIAVDAALLVFVELEKQATRLLGAGTPGDGRAGEGEVA